MTDVTPGLIIVGNLNVDMILGPQAPWPEPGTEVVLPHYELRVGGSAGNAALAAHALGAATLLIANVGSDLFGNWLAEGMGMKTELRPESGATTLSVGITHPGGERTFFTNVGHVDRLDAAFVADALGAHVTPGAIVLFCGPYLMPRLAARYGELFARVRELGGLIALDTGWPPPGWTDEARSALWRWAPEVDHLLLSEAEILGLTAAEDIADAARQVHGRMRPNAALVVKLGRAGAALWSSGATHAVSAPEVEVVDTIGAGDVFNAAYLAALQSGRSVAEALDAGVTTASLAVSTRPRRYRTGSSPA